MKLGKLKLWKYDVLSAADQHRLCVYCPIGSVLEMLQFRTNTGLRYIYNSSLIGKDELVEVKGDTLIKV